MKLQQLHCIAFPTFFDFIGPCLWNQRNENAWIYGKGSIPMMWAHGHMRIWACEHMGMWAYGRMGTWVYGHMGICAYGHLGTWAYGHIGIWAYGHWAMGMWAHRHMGIGQWACGHIGIGRHMGRHQKHTQGGLLVKNLKSSQSHNVFREVPWWGLSNAYKQKSPKCLQTSFDPIRVWLHIPYGCEELGKGDFGPCLGVRMPYQWKTETLKISLSTRNPWGFQSATRKL